MKQAELVALRVGKNMPPCVVLPDVDGAGSQTQESRHLDIGTRRDRVHIKMHPVLGSFRLRNRNEQQDEVAGRTSGALLWASMNICRLDGV